MKKAFLLFGLAVLLTACSDSQDFSTRDNYGMSQVYAATIPNDYSILQAEPSNESTVYICTGQTLSAIISIMTAEGWGDAQEI